MEANYKVYTTDHYDCLKCGFETDEFWIILNHMKKEHNQTLSEEK